MLIRLLWLSSLSIALSACSTVLPDTKVYAVAGHLQAGMDYAFTGHDETGEIGMAEAVKFLEAGALCMSSDDYRKQKTAVESLCYRAGAACSYESKQSISQVSTRINALQIKAKAK